MERINFFAVKKVRKVFIACCFFVLHGVINDCDSAEIRRLSVPRWIQNGTEDSVVLDCDYAYNENDFRLVVKWFFQDNTEPVYQWIPELNNRHVSGVLKGRLDTDFAVKTADMYSRYRAIKILRPTTELSGKYTCLVTSLAGQDYREQVMTVFVPPKEFELSYTEMSDSSVNVSCEAIRLFPLPVLRLYLGSSIGSPLQEVIDAKQTSKQRPSMSYDAYVHRTFSSAELSKSGESVVFECTLELPGTNYAKAKRIAYYPGIQGMRIDVAHSLTSESIGKHSVWILTFCSFIITSLFKWHLQSSSSTYKES
ncbi:hypothetical protein JTE90_007852 [Oedothorax gibbosus]|uniref:Ig-like domain-containing protein n=1 Tax=Oedothorax gibbosus TaxID=931172 RepID=A0AAV6VIZ7_9ARAC|nr:hypothetical protein JTE90_007852 [Oedothorax gibbosus]